MPIKQLLIAACALLFLSACNPIEQINVVDERIETWHATYNKGDARALYGQTGEEFRAATSPEQMDDLVALVTEKMGQVESAERTDTNINMQDGVTTTVVTMTTSFANGEATETFTFHGTGSETQLVGWNVDSPNFLEVPEGAVTEVEEMQPAE